MAIAQVYGSQTTTQVVTMANGQTRTGVQTSVGLNTITEKVGSSVVGRDFIPFIRSRSVVVAAHNMKPYTSLYAFFDNINVTDYCWPLKKIVLSSDTTKNNGIKFLDFKTSNGISPNENITARTISGINYNTINDGEIVQVVGQEGSTAIVVAMVVQQSSQVTSTNPTPSTETVLYVANLQGTGWIAGVNIVGKTSGAIWNITSVTSDDETTVAPLLTNSLGSVYLLFNIPNDDAIKFQTGSRNFILSDDADNNPNNANTTASATYSAAGTMEVTQDTVASIRQAVLLEQDVSENQVVSSTTSTIVKKKALIRYVDPLAQTFLINEPSGVFVTKIDLYFTSKDDTVPVTIQIRNTTNHFPGDMILPFGTATLTPDEIDATNNLDDPNGNKGPCNATTAHFEAPVYLAGNEEYCIVIMSNSNKYKVWLSSMVNVKPGEVDANGNSISQASNIDVRTSAAITSQPLLGSLFKSQNNVTWTAIQSQDLTFILYRADFDIYSAGYVQLRNPLPNKARLSANPFLLTKGETIIRVNHPEHGLFSGSWVSFAGATTTSSNPGVTSTLLNTTFKIDNVDFNSYTIELPVGTVVATNERCGGVGVDASQNLAYSTSQYNIQSFRPEGTSIDYAVKTLRGSDSISTPATYDMDTSVYTITPGINVEYSEGRVITSSEVAGKTIEGSVQVAATLTTTDSWVSPVIDLDRSSITVVNNRINNPVKSWNLTNIDDIIILNYNILNLNYAAKVELGNNSILGRAYITHGYNSSTDTSSTLYDDFKKFSIGSYIDIHNANGKDLLDALIVDIIDDGSKITVYLDTIFTNGSVIFIRSTDSGQTESDEFKIIQKTKFIDEIAPFNSSALAKYISKPLILTNTCSGFKIIVDLNIPLGTYVDVYYKVGNQSDNRHLAFKPWSLLSYIPTNTGSADSFLEHTIYPSVPDLVSGLLPENPTLLKSSSGDVISFNAMMVKLVMRSDNNVTPPRVKNLRIIALA
jgi:hypothetical protein